MIGDRNEKIRIQNIYYMLAYAFQILQKQGYEDCSVEEFENTADLLSAILARGVSIQVKRGLGRTYIEQTESISSLRGKIEIPESIKQQTFIKKRLVCTYDEFSIDTYMNRILKSTMELLLRFDVAKSRKKDLRNILLFFKDVGTIDVWKVDWKFRFDKNNKSYQMLMSVCYLIVKGLLQREDNGTLKLLKFLDEQKMHRLYEKFILEYYKKHYPQLNASAARIEWATDDGIIEMLPSMQSDIMLYHGNNILIIDAKYYSYMTQVRYDVHKLHSGNLYQMFTYVKNMACTGKNVSGLLLYAQTDEPININRNYVMSGNKIGVKTLDLDCKFKKITNQLNDIANQFLADSY